MSISESDQSKDQSSINHWMNFKKGWRDPQLRDKNIIWCLVSLIIFMAVIIVSLIFCVTKPTVAARCKNNFECVVSTECIPFYQLCNGKRDCSDSSDETVQACKDQRCLNNQFQCSYGACITENSKCNGVPDCADNSDEENCGYYTTISPIDNSPSESCLVDSSEAVGVYFKWDTEYEIQRESNVEPNTSVVYKCKSGGILNKNITNVCRDGKWITNHPKCERPCSSRTIVSYDVITKCSRYGQTIPCNDQLQHDTKVNVRCAFGYVTTDGIDEKDIFCQYGEWSSQPSKCEQICGLNGARDAVPLVVGGEETTIEENPFVVGIWYQEENRAAHRFICSGTIINANQVLTAAHCVFNENEGEHYHESHFLVVAGTVRIDYLSDPKSQVRNIAYMDHSLEYAGYEKYYDLDIVVLTLTMPLRFNKQVGPACIDTDLKYYERSIKPNTVGTVAGWGKDAYSGGISSPQLKSVTLKTMSIKDCKNHTSIGLHNYITSGYKICLANSNDTGLWQGDSGGGFIIKKDYNGTLRKTLSGIVSSSGRQQENHSDNEFTLLTAVQWYGDLIEESQQRLRGIQLNLNRWSLDWRIMNE